MLFKKNFLIVFVLFLVLFLSLSSVYATDDNTKNDPANNILEQVVSIDSTVQSTGDVIGVGEDDDETNGNDDDLNESDDETNETVEDLNESNDTYEESSNLTAENIAIIMNDIKNSNSDKYYSFINYLINEHGFEFRSDSVVGDGYLLYATRNYIDKLYNGGNFTISPNETYFISTSEKRGCFIDNDYYQDIIYSHENNYYLDEEYLSWLKSNSTLLKINITIPSEYLNIPQFDNINDFITGSYLPSKYDSRELGYVTPIKNQDQNGSTSNCWAFASISALESFLLKYEKTTYNLSTKWDLSENHLKNIMSSRGKNGTSAPVNTGGNFYMALAYLLRWSGPVNESDDIYGSGDDSIEKLNVLKHVQGIQLIHPRTFALDLLEIKKAVYNYGSVVTSLFWDTSFESKKKSNYICLHNYDDVKNEMWHDITIVGWDDNYSASNFNWSFNGMGDGAFIVKNSYGNNSKEGGYWYVSYYDKTLAYKPYFGFSGFAFTNVENVTNYGNNYYHNPLGITKWPDFHSTELLFANQWVAEKNETLNACGLYIRGPSQCLINVLVNGVHVGGTTVVNLDYAGYHTIKLSNFVNVTKGETFRIEVYLKNNGFNETDILPIEFPIGIYNRSSASVNQSFIWGNLNGTIGWHDFIKISNGTNICLNAYTECRDAYVETRVIANNLNMFYTTSNSLVAYLSDLNGNALINKIITFNINGKSYTKITDNKGKVSLNINLNPGSYRTLISFNGDDVFHESSKVVYVKVNKIVPKLILSQSGSYYKAKTLTVKVINSHTNKAMCNVMLSVKFNDKKVSLRTNSNGIATYNVPYAPGTYSVTVTTVSTNTLSTHSAKLNVKINKANNVDISPTKLTTTYDSGKYFQIKVTKDSKPMIGVKLKIKVYTDNKYKTISLTTNNAGIAKYHCSKLSIGIHKVIIESGEPTQYLQADSKTSTIKINKAPTIVNAKNIVHKYKANKYFTANIKNKATGKIITGIKVSLKVYTGKNYKTYTLTTNDKGTIYLNTKILSVGTHKVIISSANNKYTISCTKSIKIIK